MKIKIEAIEKYLPSKKVASFELDDKCKAPRGRIEKNTGVAYRHYANTTETVCEMGANALKKALAKAHLQPIHLDLLISCSAAYDYPIPHNSVVIKSKITNDTSTFNCFDVDATCLSFLNTLDIAHLYLKTGKYKRIALVCSEIASLALTPQNEKVFGLFGDAAVAMIITSHETDGYEPLYCDFENFVSGALLAKVPIGGAINRGMDETSENPNFYFDMDGKSMIRLTQKHINNFTRKAEKQLNKRIADFDYCVTHQTSRWGNEFFLRNYQVESHKVIETLQKYGNCIAASIPLGLEELYNRNQILKNKDVFILGSGAGLTFGCMALRF